MSPGLGSPRMSKKQSQMSLVEEESKQKSRNAFKKILAGKLILPLLNDMTNVYMDRLEQTLDDIKDKLQVMVESSVPITGEIVNKVMLRDRLEDIIIELQDHCDKTVIP